MSGFVVRQIDGQTNRKIARKIEDDVFAESGLTTLEEYEKYDNQSFFWGAFDEGDECFGVVRCIMGGPIPPPVFEHGMEITENREKWESLAAAGKSAEFATAAIPLSHRGLPIFFNLIRNVCRFGEEHNIPYAAMITEPERAEAIDKFFLLPSIRIGPDQHYLGESQITAPFVFDFPAIKQMWKEQYPEHFDWFINQPLEEMRNRPLRRQG